MTDPDDAGPPADPHADPVLGTDTSTYRASGAENASPTADSVLGTGDPMATETHGAENAEPADATDYDGGGIIRASWLGTTALGVAAGIGLGAHTLRGLTGVVSVVLFLAGTVLFFVAFLKAVDRSRTEKIGVLNVFFLDHSAPKPVKRSLLASLAVQAAVATAAAALRPNTAMAFAILAPVYGLSLAGLWGARHGSFPKRDN
jgi:hypothetical protein